jgi:hypothetical protein
MLLRKFREPGPDVIVLIVIILLLIWLNAFLHPHLPSSLNFDVSPMPLFGLLLEIVGSNPLISIIFTFLLVLLVAYLLVNFNTSVFFISERTFLPALIFVLLSGFFLQQQILNPALPAVIFLILAMRRIMDSYKIQGTAYSFFDAGLLISTGSFFYAGFIWFGLLLFIGIAILRPVNIKEIIISILGLATPWFIISGFYYVTGKEMNSLLSEVAYNLFTAERHVVFPGLTIAALIIMGIIILICSLHLLSAINTKKIKSRKTFILLMWIFAISAGSYFIFKAVSVEIFWFAVVPVSYIVSHYFVYKKKKLIPEILLTTLFILVAIIQIVEMIK